MIDARCYTCDGRSGGLLRSHMSHTETPRRRQVAASLCRFNLPRWQCRGSLFRICLSFAPRMRPEVLFRCLATCFFRPSPAVQKSMITGSVTLWMSSLGKLFYILVDTMAVTPSPERSDQKQGHLCSAPSFDHLYRPQTSKLYNNDGVVCCWSMA